MPGILLMAVGITVAAVLFAVFWAILQTFAAAAYLVLRLLGASE